MECCPKAVTGAIASQMGGQLLCLVGPNNVGVCEWAAGHLEVVWSGVDHCCRLNPRATVSLPEKVVQYTGK